VIATKAASLGYTSKTSEPFIIKFSAADQAALTITKEPKYGDNRDQSPPGRAYSLSYQGGSGPGAATYSVSGSNCALNENFLTATAATVCTLTVTKEAGGFFRSKTSPPITYEFKNYDQTPLAIMNLSSAYGSGASASRLSPILFTPGTNISLTAASGVPCGGEPIPPGKSCGVTAYFGGSGTGAVTFSVSGSGCMLAGSTLMSETTGTLTTCTVVATKAASLGFNAAVSPPKKFLFGVYEQASLVINGFGLYTTRPHTSTFSLSTTGGSGSGVVTYTVSGEKCSIDGNSLSGKPAPGTFSTCTVVATKSASPGYKVAVSAPITLYFNNIVNQDPLAIINTSIPLGELTANLTTSGGSGTGAVTFISSGSGCSVQGSLLSANPVAGSSISCSVYAKKASSSGYNNATSEAVTLVFTKP
jgi:hypothetical protein